VAGNGVQGFGGLGDGGPATSASLNLPEAIVFDSLGNLYIADTYENRVRKVDTTGIITTFAGNGNYYCGGDGGAATQASILFPVGLTIYQGGLAISATCSDSVRAVNLNSDIINGLAGSGSGFNGDGLTPLSTEFYIPEGLTTDLSGNLLIVDSGNGRVRKLTSNTVQTIAGGYTGDGTTAAKSNLNVPTGIAFDPSGDLFVADYFHNRVRKISSTGVVTTFAGNGISGSSGDGGLATSATLVPWSVAADLNGNVFIADLDGGVRKVDPNGIISHLGGPSYPVGLSTDPAGNVYSSSNPLIWKITPSGTATIFAGVANQNGYNGDGIPATQAYLSAPSGTAMDANGNFYIADAGNNRIRKVDTNGIISTVAGNGTYGFSGDGGLATNAELAGPLGVAFDTKGNMYIADTSNYRIRIVNSSGIIRTLAGTGNTGYNGDNLAANKTNVFPYAVGVSPNGVVFFADGDVDRVRRIK
jgi:sugar lactone lactonase YvrE